jgi:hypothetical protein
MIYVVDGSNLCRLARTSLERTLVSIRVRGRFGSERLGGRVTSRSRPRRPQNCDPTDGRSPSWSSGYGAFIRGGKERNQRLIDAGNVQTFHWQERVIATADRRLRTDVSRSLRRKDASVGPTRARQRSAANRAPLTPLAPTSVNRWPNSRGTEDRHFADWWCEPASNDCVLFRAMANPSNSFPGLKQVAHRSFVVHDHVQRPGWYRKNRKPNPSGRCRGALCQAGAWVSSPCLAFGRRNARVWRARSRPSGNQTKSPLESFIGGSWRPLRRRLHRAEYVIPCALAAAGDLRE